MIIAGPVPFSCVHDEWRDFIAPIIGALKEKISLLFPVLML